MKKIIFTLLIAMLAACGQQSSNPSVGGIDPNDPLYTVKITTSQNELRKDGDKIIASIQIIGRGGNLISAEEAKGLNLQFMVDNGLVFEAVKDKPLDFSVQREADSKVLGNLTLTATMDDAKIATKTIKVVRGNIKFSGVPDPATGDDNIRVSVGIRDLGNKKLDKQRLTAYLDGREVGSGLTDPNGNATFDFKVVNNGSEDIVSTIKVVQNSIGLEGEHTITVKPAIKTGLKLELIDKKTMKPAKGLLVGTSSSAKAAYKLKISALGNSIQNGTTVSLKSSKQGVNIGGKSTNGSCTLTGNTCSVDFSNETTGQAFLTASAGNFEASISVNFVPSEVKDMEIIASPNAINERDAQYNKSSYSSTIIVRLLAEDLNNPTGPGVGVPNKKVKFFLPSKNYGEFEPATNEVVTDSQGYATITYLAPSTQQTVKVIASHDEIKKEVEINVQKRHLAIAVGYGTGITVADANGEQNDKGDFYIHSLTIVVTDNNGKTINGAEVKVTTSLVGAETGCMIWQGSSDKGKWEAAEGAGEIITARAELEKNNVTSGLTISTKGLNDEQSQFTTKSNGVVQIDLRYMRHYAWWSYSAIRVNASYGNQAANKEIIFTYPAELSHMTTEKPTPTNKMSPYNDIFPTKFKVEKCTPKPPAPPQTGGGLPGVGN